MFKALSKDESFFLKKIVCYQKGIRIVGDLSIEKWFLSHPRRQYFEQALYCILGIAQSVPCQFINILIVLNLYLLYNSYLLYELCDCNVWWLVGTYWNTEDDCWVLQRVNIDGGTAEAHFTTGDACARFVRRFNGKMVSAHCLRVRQAWSWSWSWSWSWRCSSQTQEQHGL